MRTKISLKILAILLGIILFGAYQLPAFAAYNGIELSELHCMGVFSEDDMGVFESETFQSSISSNTSIYWGYTTTEEHYRDKVTLTFWQWGYDNG